MNSGKQSLHLRIETKVVNEPNGTKRCLFGQTSFELTPQDTAVAVRGRSGSGKTTLLRMLAGLDIDFDGEYRLGGTRLERDLKTLAGLRRAHVGYVTQEATLLRGRTIIDNVLLGLPRNREVSRAAAVLLERVGLGGWERKKVDRLSGGEAQRVCLARVLVRGPRVVLADEPTGSLDEATEESILQLFADLQADDVRFVIATHSSAVASHCSRVLEIKDRKLRPQD